MKPKLKSIEVVLVICWIHGWGSGPGVWDGVRAELPEYRHVAPSFRAVQNMDGLLAAVHAAIGEADEIILAGWSMGGMLALQAAARLGARVQGVFLAGTTLRFCEESRLGWPVKVLQKMRMRLGREPETVLKAFIPGMFSDTERKIGLDEDYIRAVQTDFTTASLIAGLEYLETVVLSDLLGTLKCPVSWVHGTDDKVCPPQAFEQTRDRMASETHRFHLLQDAGHALPFSHPIECVEQLHHLLGR